MEKFKLKEQARQFFSDSYSKQIEEYSYWKLLGIPRELLDELPRIYIEYGHENISNTGSKTTSLCSHDGNKKLSEFNFTIKIDDLGFYNFDNCNVPKLMDALQITANKFFKPLVNN